MRRALTILLAPLAAILMMAAFGSDDPDNGSVPVSLRPAMVAVPTPGTFTVGSPASEKHRFQGEGSVAITLNYGFRISETEVTKRQYRAMMKRDPSVFGDCDDCPQDYVSWNDATAYCDALSRLEGRQQCYAGNVDKLTCTGYRLPTSAEFEWLSRSGDTLGGLYPDAGVSDAASDAVDAGSATCVEDDHLSASIYYCRNTDTSVTGRPGYCQPYATGQFGNECVTTMPVKGLAADENGLYGIRGNIIEWVGDCWCPTRYVTTNPVGDASEQGCNCENREKRGCSHFENTPYCRHGWRSYDLPTRTVNNIGFRVVLNGTGS